LDRWLAGLLPCSRVASQIRHARTPMRQIAYLFNQYIIELMDLEQQLLLLCAVLVRDFL
jgi:hypothetical protein